MTRSPAGERIALALLLVLSACQSGSTSTTGEARPAPVAPSAAAADRPRFVRGPSGGAPIAPFVRERVARAAPERTVLVYVGASWCEPCKRFHDAVETGQLDGVLPPLELVEFDLDADRTALTAAGYESRLIPLFAAPDAEGRATEKRLSGSIKGPGAVNDDLVPRLRVLLAR
jgi:thiol-disulfide isomerase/thioredoxin